MSPRLGGQMKKSKKAAKKLWNEHRPERRYVGDSSARRKAKRRGVNKKRERATLFKVFIS